VAILIMRSTIIKESRIVAENWMSEVKENKKVLENKWN